MSTVPHRHTLALPTGTETLQLKEAARHRRITTELATVFDLWGYTPAETPLVDFFEIYRPFLSPEEARSVYRTVDHQGETLVVRCDTTLFLAKQLGLHLTPEELPVRIQYSDQIVRAEGENDLASNEYQQAGVELVGVPGPEGEVEVLLILIDALHRLALRDVVIHAGSHEVFDAVCQSLPREDHAAFEHAVVHRMDLPQRFPAVTPHEVELLQFIGDLPAFEEHLARWTLRDEVRAAAEKLLAILTSVHGLQPSPPPLQPAARSREEMLRVDLSELGGHQYYSGIAFSAYTAGGNAAVVRGGRYDTLLRQFGCDAPSVGFSMYTRKLPATTLHEVYQKGAPVQRAAGATLNERVAALRQGHAAGMRIHL